MNKSIIAVLASVSVLLVSGLAMAGGSVRGVARPGQTLSYDIGSAPGNRISILVDGDGDGDIDCVLVDDDGDVVSQDRDATDTCLLQGRSREYHYTLRITNNGRRSSLFTARIN